MGKEITVQLMEERIKQLQEGIATLEERQGMLEAALHETKGNILLNRGALAHATEVLNILQGDEDETENSQRSVGPVVKRGRNHNSKPVPG